MSVQRYRKKPVVIEAIQWDGRNTEEVRAFCGDSFSYSLLITTSEGSHKVSLNDFIIKGVAGDFYPCKPEIFHMTYEPCPEKPGN
jgi:hypothetical protein